MTKTADERPSEKKPNLTLIFALVTVLMVVVVAALVLYFYSAPQEEQIGKLQPLNVISVQWTCIGAVCSSPGGSSISVTLSVNSTDMPITNLSATLSLLNGTSLLLPPIHLAFPNITNSNPLMPGQTASQTSDKIMVPMDFINFQNSLVCGNFSQYVPCVGHGDNGFPLLIEGRLQNGQTFSYLTNVTISEPPIKPPIKNLRPISVVASAQTGPPPCTPEGLCNPAGPPSWLMVTVPALPMCLL